MTTTDSHRLPSRWQPLAQGTWFLLLGLSLAIFMAAIVAFVANLDNVLAEDIANTQALGIPPQVLAAYFLIVDVASTLSFLSVAVLLFRHQPHNWWLMLVSIMLATFGLYVSQTTHTLIELRPAWEPMMGLIGATGNSLLIIFLYSLPVGRFEPPWMRWAALAGLLWFCVLFLVPPYEFSLPFLPTWATFAITFGFYSGPIFFQNRNLDEMKQQRPAEWQQFKWILFGLAAALASYTFTFLPIFLFPSLDLTTLPGLLFFAVQILVTSAGLAMVPLTIGFSMMRYRLWEVDFYINRSLIYGGLTLFMVVLGLVSLLLFQWLFVTLTGREQSTVSLIIAALVAGATFQPTRRWLRRFVDQKLYGIQVKYQTGSSPARPAGPGPRAAEATTIGPYQLEDFIGRGGMAEVYRGQHTTLNQVVAIKILLAERANEEEFRARFEREAQAVARLRHPNIVRVFDFGRLDETPYMVMEYIDGISLGDYLREQPPLPLNESIALLRDVAAALDYAHSQQLVHRDVKPSNVMLQQSTTTSGANGYQAILTDFGIAKVLGGATALTKTGMVGTLDYMAPEQIRDAADVDGRADIYALGVMAYQMMAGRLPFAGSNPGATLIAHLQQPPPDPREFRPELPAALVGALRRALAKKPDDRFATAGAFVQQLKRVS